MLLFHSVFRAGLWGEAPRERGACRKFRHPPPKPGTKLHTLLKRFQLLSGHTESWNGFTCYLVAHLCIKGCTKMSVIKEISYIDVSCSGDSLLNPAFCLTSLLLSSVDRDCCLSVFLTIILLFLSFICSWDEDVFHLLQTSCSLVFSYRNGALHQARRKARIPENQPLKFKQSFSRYSLMLF